MFGSDLHPSSFDELHTPVVESIHPSYFSRLATVELQLIMQCCDKHSLLSLARCSKFTLACASADFAWRSLNPLPVNFSVQSGSSLATQVSSSLLRFCDL